MHYIHIYLYIDVQYIRCAGFDPSFKRPTCLATLKSWGYNETMSLDDNIHIYIYIYIYIYIVLEINC